MHLYCKLWLYDGYWGPSTMCDFSLYWSGPGISSGVLYFNLWPIVIPCASWRRFRKHRRKANRRFVFFHLHKKIGDLLFFCDSWSFLSSHIALSYDVVCACWKSCHWLCTDEKSEFKLIDWGTNFVVYPALTIISSSCILFLQQSLGDLICLFIWYFNIIWGRFYLNLLVSIFIKLNDKT